MKHEHEFKPTGKWVWRGLGLKEGEVMEVEGVCECGDEKKLYVRAGKFTPTEKGHNCPEISPNRYSPEFVLDHENPKSLCENQSHK